MLFLLASASCRERLAGAEDDSMNLGLEALYSKNDPVAAIPHFRRVLETKPHHYGANYQIAVALDRAGNHSEAEVYWARVLKMAEEFADLETAETASKRIANPPNDQHGKWMNSGLDYLYRMDRPEDAVDHFAKILAENPEHYGATYQIAVALDRSNRRDEARTYWENALRWAEEYRDQQTAETARLRLEQSD